MNLYAKLRQREANGRPVRIGLIGAGKFVVRRAGKFRQISRCGRAARTVLGGAQPATVVIRKGLAICAAVWMTVLLVACTPQQMLMNALVPDGTVSMLLSHLQDVESSNRQRIVELEQKGEWTELAKFADANIAKDPFSAEWQLIGGYAQLQQRNYPRAIEYFSEMVRLAPDEAAGYHFLAEAQRAAGDPQRAVVTLERALLVLRNSALTHRLLGDAYVDLNRDVTAMAAYRRALAIAPEMEAAWWGLGRVAVRAGRSADAREALRALAQMQSPHAATLRALIEAKS